METDYLLSKSNLSNIPTYPLGRNRGLIPILIFTDGSKTDVGTDSGILPDDISVSL